MYANSFVVSRAESIASVASRLLFDAISAFGSSRTRKSSSHVKISRARKSVPSFWLTDSPNFRSRGVGGDSSKIERARFSVKKINAKPTTAKIKDPRNRDFKMSIGDAIEVPLIVVRTRERSNIDY